MRALPARLPENQRVIRTDVVRENRAQRGGRHRGRGQEGSDIVVDDRSRPRLSAVGPVGDSGDDDRAAEGHKPARITLRHGLLRITPGWWSMSTVTQILKAVEQGDPHAAEQLLPQVYDELRRLAAGMMAQEKPGQTLQATALVHEAYLRLVGKGEAQHWESRRHFFAAAAEAMRRILIDRAREKRSAKRGGPRKRLDLDALDVAIQATPDQLLAIEDALAKLTRVDPAAAQLVKLRYFAGLTIKESGKALGISTATAYRHWNYARVWLFNELLGTGEE